MRFNPPPTWPVPPAGWTPPAGWEPDSDWPPAPPGWTFWVSVPDQHARSNLLVGSPTEQHLRGHAKRADSSGRAFDHASAFHPLARDVSSPNPIAGHISITGPSHRVHQQLQGGSPKTRQLLGKVVIVVVALLMFFVVVRVATGIDDNNPAPPAGGEITCCADRGQQADDDGGSGQSHEDWRRQSDQYHQNRMKEIEGGGP